MESDIVVSYESVSLRYQSISLHPLRWLSLFLVKTRWYLYVQSELVFLLLIMNKQLALGEEAPLENISG